MQLKYILCICTTLAAYASVHTQEARTYEHYLTRTYPAYAIASKADILNSTCGKELKDFRDAVDQRILWSLKVLDSSGGFKPGFLYGNNYWLGSRSQCLDTMNKAPLQISQHKILNNTHYRDPRKEFPPFQINYFVAYLRHNSTIQYHVNMFDEDVITLGLCLPKSCTTNNLSLILEEICRDRVIFNDLYPADFQLIEVKDLNDDNKKLPHRVYYICAGLIGFSFLITLIGTIYDIFIYQKRNVVNVSAAYRKNKIGEILICFSAYTNTKKIFSTKLDAGTIPVFHCLKVLGMCSIILFHGVYYTFNSLDNKVRLWRFTENNKIIGDMGLLAVDIFFHSSGCLMLMNYIYLLTPAYMTVLLIELVRSIWAEKTSQFYMYERSHETCAKYWWRSLLYIHNFFGWDAMCMSWSWYLSNDMQFYVIAMALLIFSTRYFYAAILSLLLIGSIILNGYLSYVKYEYVETFDEQENLADIFYIKPWMRMNPFIIGIITGHILAKLKNNFVLKKKHIILCWCLTIICGGFVLLLSYNRYISVLATSVYVALNRTLWAICIACVVIACSSKHGGVIGIGNQLFSFKGWIPLSRLTYCAYLINPVIIQAIQLFSETSIHFEFLPRITMTLGYIIITYLCSYLLSLMFEMPYILLYKMCIKPYRNTMESSTEQTTRTNGTNNSIVATKNIQLVQIQLQ
ncbi:nose resistant to fluoxetine protein 6-like [Temnothorax curvispinosus]|uniref:Nose resistant to fluoxetine protein 6-like n=1 Tax=Temnothorax curvispinosus TaxID=300111 RepID=A0A6J1R3V1_9HYME|nr:nose resistant to fluoxetine protein 6-like [Temnothorax curvispinosus]